MFAYYSFVTSLLAFFATLWKRLLIVLGKGTLEDLRERLALSIPPSSTDGFVILINAVSVGEVAEAEVLIRAILRQAPHARFVLTTGNAEGRVRANQIRSREPALLAVRYLPWDRKKQIGAWLHGFRPAACVTIETDIWPNLFRACRELGIPVFIVNGRVYPGDVRRYRVAARFFQHTFRNVNWIGTQTQADVERFVRIGADRERIEHVGNLKVLQASPPGAISDLRLESLNMHSEELIVAGSTHAGEEQLILEAFVRLRKSHPAIRLVLAPRKVTRVESVFRLGRRYGLSVQLWSARSGWMNDWDVLILDEVGWLAHVYAHARVAVIGGSFVPFGGHNPAEPAHHGCATIVGPHCRNFHDLVTHFREKGGLIQTTRDQLVAEISHLISDPELSASIGRKAKAAASEYPDFAGQYAEALLSRMPVSPTTPQRHSRHLMMSISP